MADDPKSFSSARASDVPDDPIFAAARAGGCKGGYEGGLKGGLIGGLIGSLLTLVVLLVARYGFGL